MTTEMAREFTLELSSVGRDTQVAAAGGAIALQEARDLERGVIAGIGNGRTRVVLDLADVTEVGPGLLGVLLRVRRGVTRVDGALALVVSGPPVSELVETTLLGSLIEVAGDRAQALALVGRR
ncbi:MAG TPA: STAS domain-containing protein [Solirubrobacteraceae bacterium]